MKCPRSQKPSFLGSGVLSQYLKLIALEPVASIIFYFTPKKDIYEREKKRILFLGMHKPPFDKHPNPLAQHRYSVEF